MEWNDETILRLHALWAEGHSTAEIGRRLGVSKNAVVGKAHRLNLPARPSPIRRDGGTSTPRPAVPRRLIGPTLPPLPASLVLPTSVSLPTSLAPELTLPADPPRVAPVAQVVQPDPIRPDPTREEQRHGSETPPPTARPMPVRPVAARGIRPAPCCWPIGEPGTKDFHFCDAEAIPGKPYCVEHAQIAYVKVRDRREEAA